MDEATLTIRLKDESSPGPAGVATTSPQYSGSDPGSVKVADQQNAITQAGGVGAMAAKNNQASSGGPAPVVAAPVPPAAALPVPSMVSPAQPSGDPLFPTVRGLVQADPSVTAAEIAKALGINQRQAQTLINAATVQPGGQQKPAPSAPLPVPPASPAPVPPATMLPPVPVPPVAPPPIASTAQQQTTGTPQAPPIQNPQPTQPGQPQQQGPDASHGVQQAVSAIAGIAAQGGPLAAAAGRAASATAAIPGVGASLAAAAPGLATAAPFIVAGAAALAVPVAAALTINSIANRAENQIGGLSPDVAQAIADSNVRRLMANIRTAGILGDEIADINRAKTGIGTSLQGIRDVVAEPLLREFADVLTLIGGALSEANELAREYKPYVQAFVKVATGNVLTLAIDQMHELAEQIRKQQELERGKSNSLLNIVPRRPSLPPPFTSDSPVPLSDIRKEIREKFHAPGLAF